jgi:hypothetical protein
MGLKDIFSITGGTKKILAITISVSVMAILAAFIYYNSVNKLEDPRIMKARELLSEYEKIPVTTQPAEAFLLLDSAFNIFNSLPDYNCSFEKGVIFNNKSGRLLLDAIYETGISAEEKERLLSLAMQYCDSSIMQYKRWMNEWMTLSAEEIAEKLGLFMKADDPAFEGLNFSKIFLKRVKNIETALIETPRRLSVSYTNKATIFRHMLEPDSSLAYYGMALDLWEDNRTARSNLNVLLGGEPVKPKLIESLFPPDRKIR